MTPEDKARRHAQKWKPALFEALSRARATRLAHLRERILGQWSRLQAADSPWFFSRASHVRFTVQFEREIDALFDEFLAT